jgi:PBSX family phage terminase large subunit
MTVLDIQTARVFMPLLEPARFKGAHGGRGSGKSHFFGEHAVEESLSWPGISGEGLRLLCYREVQKSLKESVKYLLEKKIRDFGLGEADGFRVYKDVIETPKDGVIAFTGMQDHTSESVKSYEGFHRAWGEEAQTITERSLEMLRPTIRWEDKTRGLESELWFGWNPRLASDAVDRLLRGGNLPESSIVVQANYRDNPWFPDVLELERLHDYKMKPDRYSHIWDGDYEPTALGAIWNRQMIGDNRRSEAPELSRILVSVDPAVTNNAGSDEHGIMVGGVGADKRGYLLDDVSCHGGPMKWAERAVAAFDLHQADAVVIEVNQGGDMVRQTLKTVRPNLPIIEVRASRGKHVRAEPIAAQYAMGRISHVGTYPELESQMCLMTAAGYEGENSPDRVDALVWLFTELFPAMNKKTPPKHPSTAMQTNTLKWRR